MDLHTTFATLRHAPNFEKSLKFGSLGFHVHIIKNVSHAEVIRCKQKNPLHILLSKRKKVSQ